MRNWSEFERWQWADDRYLSRHGEGDTMATQIVTAITKLVYRWFNDGDVYDNTKYMRGWANDLSSYANWLAMYVGARHILDRVYECTNDSQYTDILYDLCSEYCEEETLKLWNTKPKRGSVYECDGPYRFEEYEDYEDEWEYEEEETL